MLTAYSEQKSRKTKHSVYTGSYYALNKASSFKSQKSLQAKG